MSDNVKANHTASYQYRDLPTAMIDARAGDEDAKRYLEFRAKARLRAIQQEVEAQYPKFEISA